MAKDTKTDRIGMRVSPEQKMEWEKVAASEGLSLAAWITRTLNDELRNNKQQHSN